MIEFAFPAGAWLGAIGAAVLAAYLVRRRARRFAVPFLPLWRAVAAEARGGWGRQIQRALDLLMVLLAVAAVAFAASGPQRPGRPETVRDLVLVLDGGVSLRAGTRLEKLRRIAAAEIRRRAPGTTFALIAVADDGPLIHLTRSASDALAAMRTHEPGWTQPARKPALELAREAARRLRHPDLVFVSHRPASPSPIPDGAPAPPFRFRPVAEPAPNAGFADVELLTDPESGGLLARLTLRGEGTVSVDDLWSGPVNGRRVITVPLQGHGETTLTTRTDGDVFSADDVLYLMLPEARPPRVLVVAKGVPSPFLIAAMQALARTGVVQAELGRTVPARATDASQVYDVLVFDRCAPAAPVPGLRAIYLDPPSGDGVPFRVGPQRPAPALFTRAARHPLLRGFDPTRYPPLRARGIFGGTAVLASAAGPAVAVGPSWIAIGFDPDACVLAASPAYPLFLRNAIRHLASASRGSGGGMDVDREFLRIGAPAPSPGPVQINPVQVDPVQVGAQTRRVGSRLLGPPGFWKRGGETWAVNLLDPNLSLVPPVAKADPLPEVGRPAVAPRPYGREAAAAALGLLVLAWWVFWRNRAQ